MNLVCAVGRLTRAPVVRFEGEGAQTVTATLLIEEPGKERPFMLYVPLRFWGKSAEAASTLDAQDLVAITGKLSWAKVRTKTGEEKSSLAVEVRTVEVLDAARAAEAVHP